MEGYVMFLVFVAILQLMGSNHAKSDFSQYEIDFVKVMHREYCLLSPVCVPPKISTVPLPVAMEDGSFWLPDPEPIPYPDPPAPEMTDGSCCEDCSCDIDRCFLSGTCCPDLLEYLPSVEESNKNVQVECQYASLKKSASLNIVDYPPGLSIWMFTKCAEKFNGNMITKQKCENPSEFTEWETKVPVSDKITHDTFQNVYCAICNDVLVENLVYWNASLQCLRSVFLPSSINTIVEDVNTIPDCNIIYKIPEINMTLPQCTPKVRKCNITGLWNKYDPLIEAACHAYTAVYDSRYNNIFCFLCNEPDPYDMPGLCVQSGEGWNPKFSFSALLKFTAPKQTPEETEIKYECEEAQIFDSSKNICRNLSCLPPKVLADRICIDAVEYITGVTYEAFLKLTPVNGSISVHNLSHITADVWSIYKEYLRKLDDVIYELNLYYESNDDSVRNFVLHFKVYFGIFNRGSNEFVNKLLELDSNEFFETSNAQTFKMTLSYYDPKDLNNTHSPNNNSITLYPIKGIPDVNPYVPEFVLRSTPILVTKVLGCPLVEIKASDNTGGPKTNETSVNDIIIRFSPGTFIIRNISDDVSVFVCVDDFLSSIPKLKDHGTETSLSEDGYSAEVILSLVCTSFSIFCSILTLLAYIIFPELRTQPGVNNMALVTSLIFAQSLFEFGSDQADSIPEWCCEVIGILVHFFWLMVMFWMNVCSIHMFLVFIAIRKVSVCKKRFKQTIIYITYTVAGSTVMVCINIIVSLVHPDFDGIGYGGTHCYISDYRMVGYVFAIPVGVIVCFNLVHFLVVIVKICRMPTVSSETKQTRNFFAIYVKLSTLTGMTWIFGFVYFFTNVKIFEYLFIVLNASQGVFLFIAFVCNTRVVNMYRSKMEHFESVLPESSNRSKKHMTTYMTDINHTNPEIKKEDIYSVTL